MKQNNKNGNYEKMPPVKDIFGEGVYHAVAIQPKNEEPVEFSLDKDVNEIFIELSNHQEILPPAETPQRGPLSFSDYNQILQGQNRKKLNNVLYGTTNSGGRVEKPFGSDCCENYTKTLLNKN